MARIRTVKPEFWTDERVGECSVSARLLFVATWNFADDHGGLDRSAKQLKAQAFPYDNVDCEPLIQELLQVGLLIEYEAGGKKYLHIKGFRTHQKVEKPARPRVPLFDPSVSPPRALPEPSPSSSGNSPVSSGLFSGRESKGREGKGEGEEARTREKADGGRVAGAIDRGSRLTSTAPTSMLEDWRRDVPECNPQAFARWIVHVEESGKPMTPAMRLAQARRLAGNGDFACQDEVVTYCAENGYKSLIPIADVRHRTHGRDPPDAKPKLSWRPPPDEEPASASG